MKYFRSLVLVFSFLGIIACSDSRHKSENNTAAIYDQETVQAQIKPGLLTKDQTKRSENLHNTNYPDTGNKRIHLLRQRDSINLKIQSDSLEKEITIKAEEISLSRKKILNYQEELKFYISQLNKLITDDSMKDAVDRINVNIETVRGHIENEEEKISLAKTNINKLENDLKNLEIRYTQASTAISEKLLKKETDVKLDQQASVPVNKQALEKELADLKKLNKGINARIFYYENMLDSLSSIDQEPEYEQLRPVIVSNDKKPGEDMDQQAANQLQELASKTINQKKNMSAEQVKAAKERNSSDTNIHANRGFAKFVGIFFLIILALIGSLYFLGKFFPGKKKNK